MTVVCLSKPNARRSYADRDRSYLACPCQHQTTWPPGRAFRVAAVQQSKPCAVSQGGKLLTTCNSYFEKLPSPSRISADVVCHCVRMPNRLKSVHCVQEAVQHLHLRVGVSLLSCQCQLGDKHQVQCSKAREEAWEGNIQRTPNVRIFIFEYPNESNCGTPFAIIC